MDDIFISSVMRTSKLMGMTTVMTTKSLQNPVTANFKKNMQTFIYLFAYLFEVNNRHIQKKCEIRSELSMKTPE